MTKEERKIYNKQYREKNKEKLKEKESLRYKKYYIDNKEHRNEQSKQYYQDNIETLKEHKNQKYNCSCGGRYTTVNKSGHFKTPKHVEFVHRFHTRLQALHA